MKIVKEHIEFERGIEPAKAMNIGILDIIKKKFRKDWIHSTFNLDNALEWAAQNGNITYVKYLLDAGADPNRNDEWALTWAKNYGHKDIANLIKSYIVKESIDFERGAEPKDAMGIGIRAHNYEDLVKKMSLYMSPEQYNKFWDIVGENMYMRQLKYEDLYRKTISFIRKNAKEIDAYMPKNGILEDFVHHILSFIYVEGMPNGEGEYMKIKESVNFERRMEPKNAMKVGISGRKPKEVVEDLLLTIYQDYVNTTRGPDYEGFGKWLAEQIIELFKGATYGDYSIEDALKDLNVFLDGWGSIINFRGPNMRGLK